MLSRTPSSAAFAPSAEKNSVTRDRGLRRLGAVLLTLSLVLTMSYEAVSIYIATQNQVVQQTPPYATPASLGLQYKDVTFPSRDDHLQLKGWLIPGVLPNGRLTSQRTIIMVHGNLTNRADKGAELLNLSGDLVRRGFAVLAFDMRGAGESPAASRSFGLYERRIYASSFLCAHLAVDPCPVVGVIHSQLSHRRNTRIYQASYPAFVDECRDDT